MHTGTAADAAVCGVVRLDLASNGLSGSLEAPAFAEQASSSYSATPCSVFDLPTLQLIDLSGNALTGSLPAVNTTWCLPALRALNLEGASNRLGFSGALPEWLLERAKHSPGFFELRLEHNSFDMPSKQSLLALIARCHWGGGASSAKMPMRCTGLPPETCSAFGPERYVVSVSGNRCIKCDGNAVLPALLLMTVLAGAGVVVFYIYRLSLQRKEIMRRYFASLIIIAGHFQVRAAWDRSLHPHTRSARGRRRRCTEMRMPCVSGWLVSARVRSRR